MKTRIITGIIALSTLLPFVFIGGIPLLIVMAIFAAIGVYEMINLFSADKPISIIQKVITIALGVYLFLVISLMNDNNVSQVTAQGVFSIFIFIIFVMSMMYVIDSNATSDTLVRMLFSIFYLGLGTGSVFLLRTYDLVVFFYMLSAAFLSDIFAYFTGYLFGKHKMAPVLSPKKTWEGFFGGLFISTLFTSFFALNLQSFSKNAKHNIILEYFTDISSTPSVIIVTTVVLITVLGVVVSVFGDLIASKLKREFGIKDYGNLFPGHGGVMDRFDSVLLSSMMFISLFTFIDFINNFF